MTDQSTQDHEFEEELAELFAASFGGVPSQAVQQTHLNVLLSEQQTLVSSSAASTNRVGFARVLASAAAAVTVGLFGFGILDEQTSITATSLDATSGATINEAEPESILATETTTIQATPSTTVTAPAETATGPEPTVVDGEPTTSRPTQEGGPVATSGQNPGRPTSTAVPRTAMPATTAPMPGSTAETTPGPTTSPTTETTPGPTTSPTTSPSTETSPGPTTSPTTETTQAPDIDEGFGTQSTTTQPQPAVELETILGDEPFDISELECDGLEVTIGGSNGPDVLVGTPGPDVIAGGNGADTIYGLGGDDVICGGNGDDVIYGGPGVDTILGGNGFDFFEALADDLILQARGDGPPKEIPSNP